jgi:hypothetical protein
LKKNEITHFDIEAAGERLRLLADRALFWERESLLVLSDLHLGKAESLQGLGLPIPSGDHLTDLNRVAKLLRETRAQRVLILGDFIHQKRGVTDEILQALEKFFGFLPQIEFTLLMGNHEKGAKSVLEKLPMKLIEDDVLIFPFRFSHGHLEGEDRLSAEFFTIQGHIHPAVTLQEGSTRVRLPCFWLTESALTLPSFGSLTGGWNVKRGRKDRVFVTTGEKIFEF